MTEKHTKEFISILIKGYIEKIDVKINNIKGKKSKNLKISYCKRYEINYR